MLKYYISALAISSFLGLYAQTPAVPFGSNDAYKYGTIQTYQPSAQADATAQSWYTYWKTSFTKDCGGGRYMAVNDYNASNAYSEGQGYGMLLAAYYGDKTLFDGLLNGYIFAKNVNGVMNWTASCSNPNVSANGATDGDLDAAMGMVIASKQWPNATSPYNYAQEATKSINAIKSTMFTNCSGKIVQKPGDMFGGCNCTNPSYYATGYYRAFGKHVPADNAWWNKAADDALDLLLAVSNTSTGLNPAWTD
ncbi:MAG TPA: glycosyl hydrolase family 8, partial [Cytophagales bacterium]|nr:glycosyl hydrolase family 8 [Cytophagales bacterium]